MTAIQTGSGLRSRKVDPKRAMAVVRFDHVNDLDEDSMTNTTIPKVATGVEKEEEEVRFFFITTSFSRFPNKNTSCYSHSRCLLKGRSPKLQSVLHAYFSFTKVSNQILRTRGRSDWMFI
jgi:hypothetical protein